MLQGFQNVNGWTESNSDLRILIIKGCNCDILCSKRNDKIFVENFTWFGHNRLSLHVNARKGSGGVGFLLHNSVLIQYNVDCINRTIEGVLIISLCHKQAETKIVLLGCYLPPEHSTRGRMSHDVFFIFEHTHLSRCCRCRLFDFMW